MFTVPPLPPSPRGLDGEPQLGHPIWGREFYGAIAEAPLKQLLWWAMPTKTIVGWALPTH